MSEYYAVHGKPLTYSQAYEYFITLLSFLSLDSRKLAMRSPRRGGTTEAFWCGVPDHMIDLQGRWKLTAMKYCYLKLTDRETPNKLARTKILNVKSCVLLFFQ